MCAYIVRQNSSLADEITAALQGALAKAQNCVDTAEGGNAFDHQITDSTGPVENLKDLLGYLSTFGDKVVEAGEIWGLTINTTL